MTTQCSEKQSLWLVHLLVRKGTNYHNENKNNIEHIVLFFDSRLQRVNPIAAFNRLS